MLGFTDASWGSHFSGLVQPCTSLHLLAFPKRCTEVYPKSIKSITIFAWILTRKAGLRTTMPFFCAQNGLGSVGKFPGGEGVKASIHLTASAAEDRSSEINQKLASVRAEISRPCDPLDRQAIIVRSGALAQLGEVEQEAARCEAALGACHLAVSVCGVGDYASTPHF
jgi:hypothetical protein